MQVGDEQSMDVGDVGHETFQQIFKLGALASKPVRGPDGALIAFVPESFNLVELRDKDANPARVRRHQTFFQPPSFIAYVNDFAIRGRSRVFVNPDTWEAQAVIDYDRETASQYEGGQKPEEVRQGPSLGTHRATLKIRKSRAYTVWTKFVSESRSQEEFAEFVEEHALDIIEPDSSKIVMLVRQILDFSVNQASNFKRKVQLEDGSTQFAYTVENQVQSVALPSRLLLGIDIIDGAAERDQVEILIRYRVNEGKLRFHLVPRRLDEAVEAAFGDLVKLIEEKTDLPVHIGSIPA